MNPKPTPIPVVFKKVDPRTLETVSRAMSSARAAQPAWANQSISQRLKIIREFRHLVAEHASELAAASSMSRGRLPQEALTSEVMPLAEACRFLEREAGKILKVRNLGGRGLPLWLSGVRSKIFREPFGVVLIIGPGNYPLFVPAVQALQALVAGNAVAIKPGVGGSAAAEVFKKLLARAGIKADLVAVLPESVEAARTAVYTRPDKVLFTGSAGTGSLVLGQLAAPLIPATLELSGNDAVIIRGDADAGLAASALAFGLTLNGGATCIGPRRVFVSAACASELEGRLAQALSAFDGKVSMPETLRPLIQEALAGGAHFIAGEMIEGEPIVGPIVLGGVSSQARLLSEDFFAPILSVVTVVDDREAVVRTNGCELGLAASIFSRDERTAQALGAQLRAGTVTINDLIIPTADARLPFGGRRRSGYGVTRGKEGLLELTQPKVVTISRGKFRPALAPAQPGDEEMFKNYLAFSHSRTLGGQLKALLLLVRQVWSRFKTKQ